MSSKWLIIYVDGRDVKVSEQTADHAGNALRNFRMDWIEERGFPEADVLLIVQDSGLGATAAVLAKEKLNLGCISIDSYRGEGVL